MTTPGLEELSPFQLKDQLIRYAKDQTAGKAATHKFLNAGRGNPNWIATTPREAFFLLGQFGLAESKRVWDEPDLGGMPAQRRHRRSVARLPVRAAPASAGARAAAARPRLRRVGAGLRRRRLRSRADRRGHRRQLPGARSDARPHRTGRAALSRQDDVRRAAAGRAASTCSRSRAAPRRCATCSTPCVENRLLRRGDTIALGTPIFTPYLELPHLEDLRLHDRRDRRRARWPTATTPGSTAPSEIDKLADPRIKAFFLVNPSNPASFAMHPDTQRRLVDLVRTKRPDLIDPDRRRLRHVHRAGFRSLAADLPRNTILVYSYSKHFGCTGWRLGVIGAPRGQRVRRAAGQRCPRPIGRRCANVTGR